MTDIFRASTLTSKAKFELHLFGRITLWVQHPTPSAWIITLSAVQREASSGILRDTLQLAGVSREAGLIPDVKRGTIYWLEASVVRHSLWKAWKRSMKPCAPMGFAHAGSAQLLDRERVMANSWSDALAVQLRDLRGNRV